MILPVSFSEEPLDAAGAVRAGTESNHLRSMQRTRQRTVGPRARHLDETTALIFVRRARGKRTSEAFRGPGSGYQAASCGGLGNI